MTEEEESILQPSECIGEKRIKDELRVEAATSGLDDSKRDSPRITPRSPLTPRTPKSPLTHISHSCKRDSGYLTDSPASFTTAGHFTYELTSPQEELHELGEVFSSDASTSDREDLGHMARSDTPVSLSESSSRNASPHQMRVCTWRTPVTEPIPIPVRRSGLDMPIPPFYQYGASPPRTPRRPSPFASTGSLSVHAGQWSSSRLLDSPSRTTATQTPAQHSQIIEEAIQWQVGGLTDGAEGLPDVEMEDDDDDDEEVFVPIGAPELVQRSFSHRIEARGTAVERLRCYSDSAEVRISHEPLPDLIQFRRDRTRSESAVQPLLRQEVGQFARELRRISDEFHLSYSPTESRLLDSIEERRNSEELDNHSASFPGARGTWFDNLCEFIRPNTQRHERRRPRAHSDVTSGASLSRREHF